MLQFIRRSRYVAGRGNIGQPFAFATAVRMKFLRLCSILVVFSDNQEAWHLDCNFKIKIHFVEDCCLGILLYLSGDYCHIA